MSSFRKAWKHYVRGHVVSKHARRLIVNFLSSTCVYSSKADEEDEEDQAKNVPPPPVPGMALDNKSLVDLLQKLKGMRGANKTEEAPQVSKDIEECSELAFCEGLGE